MNQSSHLFNSKTVLKREWRVFSYKISTANATFMTLSYKAVDNTTHSNYLGISKIVDRTKEKSWPLFYHEIFPENCSQKLNFKILIHAQAFHICPNVSGPVGTVKSRKIVSPESFRDRLEACATIDFGQTMTLRWTRMSDLQWIRTP